MKQHVKRFYHHISPGLIWMLQATCVVYQSNLLETSAIDFCGIHVLDSHKNSHDYLLLGSYV